MALGLPNTSTVPRKRRPRAVGEVFISSSSRLYLVDRHEQSSSSTSSSAHPASSDEPFYENTATEGSVTGSELSSSLSAPLVDPKGRVLYLSVVRVRQPDQPEIPGDGHTARPDVPPRRKNRSAAAGTGAASAGEEKNHVVGEGSFEFQVVSAFVGELWVLYAMRRGWMLHKSAQEVVNMCCSLSLVTMLSRLMILFVFM